MDRQIYQKRFDQLKQEAQNWIPTWKELSKYIDPERGIFDDKTPNRGKDIDYKILNDATATKTARSLASNLQSGLTTPSLPWFKLTVPDSNLAEQAAVRIWLNQVQEILIDIFAKSNSYNALYSIYEELAVFATGAALILEDYNDVIRWVPLTIGEYYLGVGADGRVNSFAREVWMTVEQLVTEFGIDNVSDTVKNAYNNNNLNQWLLVCHLIEPNDNRIPDKKDFQNMKYRSIYWESSSSTDKVLRKSGYHEFPVVAPRWDIVGSNIYGTNNPGRLALGDSRMLQEFAIDKLKNADLVNNPPIQAPSGIDTVNTAPNGFSNYGETENSTIKPVFNVAVMLDPLDKLILQTRNDINETFFKNLFMMFSTDDKTMTATEVQQRNAEKLLSLGPILERLFHELLKPSIDRVYNIAYRARILPEPPQELADMEIKVDFISTLAQAQKMIGNTSLEQILSFITRVSEVNPSSIDKGNFDEMIDQYAEQTGVSPKVINSDDVVEQMRKQRAQIQAQQTQAQNNIAMVEGAKKLSETNTSDKNALTDVLKQMGGSQ